MTGTTIAQVIPVMVSPILTRIYTPEDFGVFALFISISMILASIANARYDMSIMLPRRDINSVNLLILGIIISFFFTILFLVIMYVWNDKIPIILNNKEISHWLYYIPIFVFFLSLFNLLNIYNNRIKKYNSIKHATITKAISFASIQLIFGLIKNGVFGLIVGSISSTFFSIWILAKNISIKRNNGINLKKIFFLMKKYRQFPLYSIWSILATNLNIHSISLFITNFFTVNILGFYSLVQRTLELPFVLIGNSIGQIFFQNATKEYEETKMCIKSFKYTLKILLLISIPIFSILYFTIIDLFIFIFGQTWEISGVFAKTMLPFFFMRFIIIPLTFVNIVTKKENISMYLQFIFLFITVSSFLIMYKFDFSIFKMLDYYSIIGGTYYIFYLFILYKISQGRTNR